MSINLRTLDALVQLNSSLIVYISNDPATLSRDIRRFTVDGYQLAQAPPFDMFP